ncbi:MAG TPA: hypothetical protein VH877_07415 [Polyangia bacterium]|jgi:hypothetical protein|nr:hypothetical protein [Polyangia bacterium]
MPGQSPPERRHVDGDGVTRVEERSGGATLFIGLGLILACACLALVIWVFFVPSDGRPRAAAGRGAAEPGERGPGRLGESAMRAPEHAGGSLVDTPSELPPDEPLEGSEAAGAERSGIKLFPPPGTKPIKRGILVPEDFELPPGYLRHYQTTDDGQQVPAILMFHPDYKPLDKHGVPLPLPEDRVVTPELAPPGLPIKFLEVPKVRAQQQGQEQGGSEPTP